MKSCGWWIATMLDEDAAWFKLNRWRGLRLRPAVPELEYDGTLPARSRAVSIIQRSGQRKTFLTGADFAPTDSDGSLATILSAVSAPWSCRQPTPGGKRDAA
jgi:hypothetical protein